MTAPAASLPLYPARSSPYDLAVTGDLAGVPTGATRFAHWADLRSLPTHRLTLTDEFVPGSQEVTVVFLSDLWRALPVADGADTLLAQCDDGYASIYRRDFVARYRPFLILEINGQGPEKWPPPGLTFNPAPYVIAVAPTVESAVARLLDVGHKKPWAVTTLVVARFEQRFSGAFAGKRATLSAHGAEGREIWINSCASCHPGPDGMFGGTKSGQPFSVLVAIAACDPALFRKYVRDPKAANPAAKMEAHPHYSDAQLDALIAFVTAEQAK